MGKERKRVVVIGAGVSGLSAAASLAHKGYNVTVIEKFDQTGGRNRTYSSKTSQKYEINSNKDKEYLFEIGPSWLWMPQVHDEFFASFGKRREDYIKFKTLSPAYQVIFNDCEINVPNGKENFEKMLCSLVESDLGKMKQTEFIKSFQKVIKQDYSKMFKTDKMRYNLSMDHFLDKPCFSPTNFITSMSWISRFNLFSTIPNIGLYQSQKKRVYSMFAPFNESTNQAVKQVLNKLRVLLSWPVIFVGGAPDMIPEVYSLLLYSAVDHGTLVPEKGMYGIIEGMTKLCKELGVKFKLNSTVEGVSLNSNESKIDRVIYVDTPKEGEKVVNEDEKFVNSEDCEEVVVTADMAWFEQNCLSDKKRMYSDDYWKKTICSPSCLLFFVGLNVELNTKNHHVLFFDGDLDQHMNIIYPEPGIEMNSTLAEEKFKQMKSPLFYINLASKSHKNYANKGNESVFILIPTPHCTLTPSVKDYLFQNVMKRISQRIGFKSNGKGQSKKSIFDCIEYKEVYDYDNFISDYHSLKGNAFGISNSLLQTAFMRPRMESLKINNLSYAGQSTVPGGGIPPCILSGRVVADIIDQKRQKKKDFQKASWLGKFSYLVTDSIERASSLSTVWLMHKVDPYLKF